jgi:hypothetical protein
MLAAIACVPSGSATPASARYFGSARRELSSGRANGSIASVGLKIRDPHFSKGVESHQTFDGSSSPDV